MVIVLRKICGLMCRRTRGSLPMKFRCINEVWTMSRGDGGPSSILKRLAIKDERSA
jgi:hypothetical protein